MLNDLLIDKLNLIALKEEFCENTSQRKKIKDRIRKVLSQYFPDGSYRVYDRYAYIHIEFNPTLYSRTDKINIQMLPEVSLLELFNELELLDDETIKHFNISEIHLAKDLKVKGDAESYFGLLSSIKPKNRFHPFPYINEEEGNSIYFYRLKKTESDKDEHTRNKIIKFYCKTYELQSKKKKIDISNISLREPLTECQQKTFSNAYNAATNTIDLTGINMIRSEYAYRQSRFTKEVAKQLTGDSSYDKFPLSILKDFLQQGILYNELDKVLLNELKKTLFYVDTDENITKDSGNSYYIALSFLHLEDSDLSYIKNVFKSAEFSNKQINTILDDMNKNISCNIYYKELYKHLFSDLQ